MISKFSVIQMMEAAKKREEQKNKRSNIKKSKTSSCIGGIREEFIQSLTSYGFKLEQIMVTHSKYKFTSVEEALQLMTRDPETKLFNHEFVSDYASINNNIKSNNNNQYNDAQSNNNGKENNQLNYTNVIPTTAMTRNNNKNNTLKCLICYGEERDHIDKIDFPIDINQKEKIKKMKNDNLITSKKYLSHVKKTTDLEILNQDYDENMCPICFDNSVENDHFSLQCKHRICEQCLKDYFRVNIREGKVNRLLCLYGGCNLTYPHNIVKQYTCSNDWDAYKRYVKNNERITIILNNQNIIHCPYPDCDELIELHNRESGMILPEHFVNCNEGHRFCLKCRRLERNHQVSCESYEENLMNEISELNKLQKFHYKKCPNCNIIIEKAGGCNKMRCINCDFEFCWLCLQEYEDDHYAIYNFSGCPGLKYADDEQNTWRANPCTKCIVSFCSCILMLIIALFIIAFFFFFGCAFEFVSYYLTESEEDEEEDQEEDDGKIFREHVINEQAKNISVQNSSRNYINNNNSNNKEAVLKIKGVNNINNDANEVGDKNKDDCNCKKIVICCLLAILGIFLQPLYLLFYILIGMMECYRRFACWYFYF